MRYHWLGRVAGLLLLATALYSPPASADPGGRPVADPAGRPVADSTDPQVTATAAGIPSQTPAVESEAVSGLTAEQVYAGAAVAGGAFMIGVVATGSLASGLAAATAVAIAYAFMP